MGWDWLNPFSYLAGAAGKVVADGWTAAMLGLWNAGLWMLKLVLGIVDAFTTPDLTAAGPGAQVYQYTFWIAGSLALAMGMLQLGVTAIRRDGKSLARVALGAGQFVMVWAGWLAYAAAVLAACGGLTRALLKALLSVDAWSAWQPWAGFSTEDITDGTVATVLGILGVFVVFAAIGHLLVMLTRAAALLVLAATAPISAAGLLSEVGRGWFWKSLRWFHAAAFTPVLMALVLGIGVQLTQGVVVGDAGQLDTAVATAVPGVLLICIGCFAPLALFKLLAFVEPGTSSGAAMRAGLAAQGGIQGLLGAQTGAASGGGGDATTGAASSTDEHGKSQAETSGEDATTGRFGQAARGLAGQVGGLTGGVGQAGATGLGVVAALGARAATVGADITNGMGVGHNNYVPDFSSARRSGTSNGSSSGRGASGPSDDDNPDVNGGGDADSGVADQAPDRHGTFGLPPTGADHSTTAAGGGGQGGSPAPGGPGGPGAASGARPGGAGAGGSGAAAAASAAPVVPV